MPFYIGIGTIQVNPQGIRTEHKRAFTSSKRNFLWKNIVNKTKYRVDIIFYSDSKLIIKEKEIEFIKIYGRKDFKEGSLINNTNGGDGRLSPNKTSMINVGKNLDLYREQRRKKVFRYDLDGNFMKEYPTLISASKELNVASCSAIVGCCKQNVSCKSYKNSLWFYTFQGIKTQGITENHTRAKRIGKYDLITGEQLEVFDSLIQAEIITNISFKAISRCAIGKSKSSGGYMWKYL